MSRSAAKPTWQDRVALYLLRAAKLRRRSLRGASDNERSEFYDTFFDDKDGELYLRDARSRIRRATVVDALTRYVPAPARVVDYGCGLGDILSGVSEGYVLHGTDFSPRNVALAKRRLDGKAEIRQADLQALPFPDETFDVAICLEVLEHIPNDALALAEIHRTLNPSGILIAAVPYTYYWPEYLNLMGHFRHYSRSSFVEVLSGAGFEVEEYLPNYPHWHQRYARGFAWRRGVAALLGGVTGSRDVFCFRWPFSRFTALETFENLLEGVLRSDSQLEYACLETSTLVVARKRSL